MRQDEQLTAYEAFSMFTLVFLYQIFSEVLHIIVRDTGTAAWLAQLFSSLLAFGYLGLFYLLYRRYRNMDLLQILRSVYGTPVAKLLQGALFVYLIIYAGIVLNQGVEALQFYAYSSLRALRIDLLIMAAVVVMGFYSIKGMAKMASIYLPVIFFGILAVLLLSHRQYDSNLLSPVLGYGAGNTALNGLQLASKFNGIVVLSIFGGSFGTGKQYGKSACLGIVASSALLVFATLCYNMAIPYSSATTLRLGIMGIAQGNYASRFLQRLESVYVAMAVLALLLLLGINFLCAKKVYCDLFAIQKQHSRAVIVPLAVLVLCFARTIGNFDQFKEAARYFVQHYSVFFYLGLLVVTLLVSILRRQGGRGRPFTRAAAMLLVPCLLGTLLSGCDINHEPDSQIYPVMMGYDRGENEKYCITMKFMLEEQKSIGPNDEDTNAAGNVPQDVIVLETPSFTEGYHMLDSLVPKSVSLLHIKMLVISEELAREGLAGFASLMHYSQVKPTMALVICKDKAYDFVVSQSAALTDSVQADLEMVLETSRDVTSYVVISMSEFMYSQNSAYGDALAMYGNVNQSEYSGQGHEGETALEKLSRAPVGFQEGYLAGQLPVSGNGNMELAGMAVFRQDKMVGTLNTVECQTLVLLEDLFTQTHVAFPDMFEPENHYVSLDLRSTQPPNIRTSIDAEGKAHIQIDITVNSILAVSQNTAVDYLDDPALHRQLNDYCADIVEERCKKLIRKLQTEYRSDVLQLGRHMARNFTTIQQWEEYNWAERYPEAEIGVSYTINL